MLDPLVKSGRAHITDLEIDGTYTDARHWDSRITGHARIETPEGLKIATRFDSRVDDAGKAVDLTAGPLDYQDPFNGKLTIQKVSYRHDEAGIRFDLADAPGPPVTVPFTSNRLGLLVGGDEYFEALLDVVGKAREGVMLETFGFPEGRIVDALVKAVRRGVNITIVVPEDTGNEFELGNNLSLLRLLEASNLPGAGKVDLRYMQTRGDWTYHVHSKVLVADGKRALVGSANVDQRAMRGLAWTGQGRILWNKELDLDVADPAFARRVDAGLFGKDATRPESRDVWEKIAATKLEGALLPRGKAYERFHQGRPISESLAALADELKGTYHKEANGLLGNTGDTPAESQAGGALVKALSDTNLYWDREWQLTAAMVGEVRQAAQSFKADPAGSEAKLRALQERMRGRTAEAVPEGRGRNVEQHQIQAPFDGLLAQLKKHPDGGAPWFVDHVAGSWALATSHAALYALEGAMGEVYRAGGMARHGDTARALLRPDEQKAQLSDAFNVLF